MRKPKITRASEADIAFGVLVVAAFQSDGIASFHRLKLEIPNHVKLSDFDTTELIVRQNEPMWVQELRNIILNQQQAENFISEGYLLHIPRVGFQITRIGRRRRMGGRHGMLSERPFT